MGKKLKDYLHFDFVELDLDYNNRSFDFLMDHVTQDNLKRIFKFIKLTYYYTQGII